ncbi:MAG: L,D-transpeptidase [Acidobacteria bacterium]|nr:L,D-transpeptidase [Acidobacteriota bacterium]MBV9476984.1 L,D-transpeptidase [Acidobacteriota bacterium]
MPERRNQDRPGAPDRRTFPRPPLWLNLLLLILGIGGALYARRHREEVSAQFSHVITEEARTPDDVKAIKDQLADMDLSQGQLEKELEGRMKLAASLKTEDFYLSVDTRAHKLRFMYAKTVLRDADVQLGESRTIAAGNEHWTFIPVKGAFPVQSKIVDYAWTIPPWVYAMNGQTPPPNPPTITGGLGKYVLFLPNGYVIHTPPSPDSPLKGPKPGSIMVSEDVLNAIWPRIHPGMQVYIY